MKIRAFLLSLHPFREQYPDLTKREIEKMAGEYVVTKVFADVFEYPVTTINREGKPYVEDCPYHFNLSHSGDWLLLAVGESPVGADIEKITKIRPNVMEKYFTKEEQNRVKKEGTDSFFALWTQKESYVKYTGDGLKGLSKDLIYPEDIGFFTKKHDHYQITVCTKKDCLPMGIEILT